MLLAHKPTYTCHLKATTQMLCYLLLSASHKSGAAQKTACTNAATDLGHLGGYLHAFMFPETLPSRFLISQCFSQVETGKSPHLENEEPLVNKLFFFLLAHVLNHELES